MMPSQKTGIEMPISASTVMSAVRQPARRDRGDHPHDDPEEEPDDAGADR